MGNTTERCCQINEQPGPHSCAWRDLLAASEWPLSNRLRDWWGQRAKAEGLPPSVICNNRQLAEVVKRRPVTGCDPN